MQYISSFQPDRKIILQLKKSPLPILIVIILLILSGVVGFIYHLQDFADANQKLYETILVELLRIVAIIAGVLLLKANSMGKWLAIGWVLLHVIISAFNSLEQTLMHIAVLVIVSVLLFLPVSARYFKKN